MGGDADGLAGVLLANADLGGPNDDRFDHGPISHLEEQLLGFVGGFLGQEALGGGDVEFVLEAFPEGLRQVAHLIP